MYMVGHDHVTQNTETLARGDVHPVVHAIVGLGPLDKGKPFPAGERAEEHRAIGTLKCSDTHQRKLAHARVWRCAAGSSYALPQGQRIQRGETLRKEKDPAEGKRRVEGRSGKSTAKRRSGHTIGLIGTYIDNSAGSITPVVDTERMMLDSIGF